VDLVFDLERDVRFDGRLVHASSVAPVQHLLLGQIGVRREATSRRSERAATVAGAVVVLIGAVASPIGGDDDIGEGAFGRFDEKAFDDPEDGHKLAGFEGLDAGAERLDFGNQQRDKRRDIHLLVLVFAIGIDFVL